MKKNILNKILVLVLSIGLFACNDFLDIAPIDNLSGNNFWKTKADVESFNLSLYNRFRNTTMISSPYFVHTGDFRGAPVVATNTGDNFISDLRKNDLGTYITRSDSYKNITIWKNFYEVIQLANILHEQAGSLTDVLTLAEVKSYQAQAVFMRNLTYFFLVRTFGDVPYYTKSYQAESLPRTNMIKVLNMGITDLTTIKNDLPWTYEDQSKIAVRANRGAVIALLMHMNMWAAGFDTANSEDYYKVVAELGREIMEDNQGAYELLALNRTQEIFSGGSKEGLFEIVQNVNANEGFNNTSIYSNYVLQEPYTSRDKPQVYYASNFMTSIYPPSVIDGRKNTWFDQSIYTSDGTQQMFKFLNPYQGNDGALNSNAGNQVVFRYTGAVLLRAEALAALNRDAEALDIVNLIRNRAQATPFASSGNTLDDDIYWERVRELMGEGHYFYDLVRTRKVYNGNYSFAPISASGFNEGAWTWPLDVTALDNNPLINLNQYWN